MPVIDFREVNKWLVQNLFPIPKISTVIQALGGFTCVVALGLNIVITPLERS